MKARTFSWTPVLVIGFFIVFVTTISVRDFLPRYSVQASASTLLAWISGPNLESTSSSGDFQALNRSSGEAEAAEAPSPSSNPDGEDYDEESPSEDYPPQPSPADDSNAGNTSLPHLVDVNNGTSEEEEGNTSLPQLVDVNNGTSEEEEDRKGIEDTRSDLSSCDFYTGSWVRDESYPLFRPFECPFTDVAFQCQENGRKDVDYLKWRWQPSGCEIPRFNALHMLRKLRKKRLVFVGDSLGRNQWESLVCMLYQAAANKSNVFESRRQRVGKAGPSYIVRFSDYNTQVEYYRSHFLAIENRKAPGASKKVKCSLTLDRLDKSVSRWKNADILVFNSGHWWTHSKIRKGKCYFIEGGNFTTKMNVLTAYEKTLKTWSWWIDHNPVKRVFFRGFSPSHFSGGDWDTGGTCDAQYQPLKDESQLGPYPDHSRIAENVLKGTQKPVTFLNVSKLTLFRKDGHAGTWGRPHGQGSHDCSHWCLPGVPDTWNHLLYASLESSGW